MIKNLSKSFFLIFFSLFIFSCSTEEDNLDNEKPSTPTNITSSEITKNSFLLTWKASTDNVGVTEYTIYLDDTQFTTTETKYTFAGLSPNTSYSVSVEAKDAAGNTSEKSPSLPVKTLIPEVDIYLSASSKYLKNGIAVELENVAGFTSSGNLIHVQAGNVYSAGNVNRTSQRIAAYWKNGQINLLEPSNSTSLSNVEDISVSGNDVYAVGSVTQYSPFYYYKCYWKNGVRTILDGSQYSGSFSQPETSVMKIDKGDVYIASENYNQIYKPVYWKNGVMQSLSFSLPINQVSINCIDVENNDIYIAGSALDISNSRIGFYWKNNVFQRIDGCENVSAIDVVGSDVYAAGRTATGVAYWKNGKKTDIPFGQGIPDIQVVNNDVYVSAQQITETTSVTKIFKNGLEISTVSGIGHSRIFVVEK